MTRCGDCGFDNSEAANFCGGCGCRLRVSLRVGETAPPPPAEIQVESGSLRLVTVMFVDVQASLEHVRDQDPEAIRGFLNRVLSVIRDSVTRFGGTVAQIAGDGVMALFGAPVALEDHAVRACHAALAMHDAMAALDQEGGHDAPKLRIGLNSGSVIVGTFGPDESFGHSAIGATTFMAARMEQIATAGSTRISRDTLSLAEGYVVARPMGDCVVKGVPGAVETFELTGATGQAGLNVRMRLANSRFSGRAAELGAIDTAVQDPAPVTTVRVSGEPGVGKSRVVLQALAADERRTVLLAAGLSHERFPFGSLVRALKGYLGIGDRDGLREVAGKLEALLGDLDLQQESLALQTLLDLPVSDPRWTELDPAQRRQRMFQAFRGLVDSAGGGEVVLVCDDLQWFDADSIEVLRFLVTNVESRLTLIAIHRSDWTPADMGFAWGHELEVRPLPDADAAALLVGLMGDAASLADLRRQIMERTYGNPLFMEEMVRSMTEEGIIIGEPGDYELADSDSEPHLPASVESVISARLDRVADNLRPLLTAAAVLASDFSADLLAGMVGARLEVVAHGVQQLVEVDMLALRQSTPQPEYGFRHVTIREVLYGSLLREARVALHARATRALEANYADRLPEHMDALADHSYAGELWAETARYQLAASVRAVAGSANRHAIDCIERGLAALAHLGSSGAAAKLGIDMRLAALAAHMPLGNMDEVLDLVGQAREIAEKTGDQRRLGAVYSQVATATWYTANYDTAFDAAERALGIAASEGDGGLRMRATYNLGMVFHARGDFTRTIDVFSRLIDAIDEPNRRRRFGWVGYPESFCRAFKASALTYLGDFAEALTCFGPGIELADEVAHPYSQTLLREEQGFCYIEMGCFDEAIAVLGEALRTAEEQEVATMIAPTAARLAVALCRAGRHEEAAARLQSVEDRGTWRAAAEYGRNFLTLAHVEVSLCRGDVAAALEQARRVESATAASMEHNNGYALQILGDVLALDAGSGDAALGAYDSAAAFAGARGMRPLRARVHSARARLLDARGETARAAGERDALADLCQRLGVAPSAFGVPWPVSPAD